MTEDHLYPSLISFRGLRLVDTEAVDECVIVERFIASEAKSYGCFCEANLLSMLSKDNQLIDIMKQAAFVFPDGIAVASLTRWRNSKPVRRIPGPSFMLRLCEHGVSRGWRHYFYGGAPGVADALAKEMQSRFPGLIVAGTHCPPFRSLSPEESLAICKQINNTAPDIIWVGLGGPKQEYWMADHRKHLEAPLLFGVGAAFDFHTGAKPWAPSWVRDTGFEWLFRMFTGGKRTFFRNLRCVPFVGVLLIKEFVLIKVFRSTSH